MLRPPRSLLFFVSLALSVLLRAGARQDLNFNPDWLFMKADPAGAQAPGFDDASWGAVSTPHTYNDTDTFAHWSVAGHRGEQASWGGRTWYRKHFAVPESFRGRKVFIEFEAARQVAEVYLNGKRLGVAKTGFTPFGFDLTDGLLYGADNVLAVMCDNRFMKDPMGGDAPALGSHPAGNPNLAALSAKVNETVPDSLDALQADQIPWNNPHWHPAHGGLYRNVTLHVTDTLHIGLPLYSFLRTEGPYAYATDITDESARVGIDIPLVNERGAEVVASLKAELVDADGKTVLTLQEGGSVGPRSSRTFTLAGLLKSPRFWEPDYPHVYAVVCTISLGGIVVDSTQVPLGIRTVRWDADRGFFINGHPLKLHGWGQKPTDEWPGLGAAQPNWLHDYTLALMKQAGGNFVRWGHCASAPSQIAESDQLGLVTDMPGVDGESDTRGAAWLLRTQAFRDTLIYFRNNPSILIWEGGNQKVSREHAKELRGLKDRLDPRGGRAYAHRRPDLVTAEYCDVQIGTEGGREVPSLPVVEGEYDREESPRRVWDQASPPHFGYPEAKGQTYQLTSEHYAVNEITQWMSKLSDPAHCGGANWIFSDSTSGGRVSVEVARAGGEVDGVRLPKEAYYVCSVIYRDEPQVHIIGHWTYPAGTVKDVFVASNADSVELQLNGRSLGQGVRSKRYLFTFPHLAWQPGELRAVARTNGAVVATHVLRTAGEPVALRMSALTAPSGLRADGSDVALIDVEAVDEAGQRCPTFEGRVAFETEGPATWRGGYNSGRIDSVNAPYLDLECGINRVAIRAGRTAGAITVRAQARGLKPAAIQMRSLAFEARGGWSPVGPARSRISLPGLTPAPAIDALAVAARGWATNSLGASAPGKYTRSLTYSGPGSAIVHVEVNAQDGRNAYVDIDSPFSGLPTSLRGADWLQAAFRDSLYSAEDLVQVGVPAGSVVTVAHDDRLQRPRWLVTQFKPSHQTIRIDGHSLGLFTRETGRAESLTLGSNTDDPRATEAEMYVVFVKARSAQ